MVSIIERSDYIKSLRASHKFDLFLSLLLSTDFDSNYSIDSELDEVFFDVILAVKTGNKEKFYHSYTQLSLREPKKTSPYINDDLLLFVLILGVFKFNISRQWLEKVLSIRVNTDTEGKLIKDTFLNLINENFTSLDNCQKVVFVFQSFLDLDILKNKDRSLIYKELTTVSFPYTKSDFLNTIYLKSYDIIITDYNLSEDGKIFLLNSFNSVFIKRIRRFTKIIKFVLIIVILYSIMGLTSLYAPLKAYVEKVDLFIGVSGVSLAELMFPNFNKKIMCILLDLLGYPKKLIHDSIFEGL